MLTFSRGMRSSGRPAGPRPAAAIVDGAMAYTIRPARTRDVPVIRKLIEPVKPGPGVETPYGIRSCNMSDGMPEGAVMDGYVKKIYSSPFGKTCGWERVK